VSDWSFDMDTVKFDAEVPTWDAGLVAGEARLHLSDSTFVSLPLANVGFAEFTYDRGLFRSPYGTVWHQDGDKRRLVEAITLQAFVVDDAGGISDAAVDAGALLGLLLDVTRVESGLRIWNVVALGPSVRQPVESGYRFDITWAYTSVV
jgi:hypothetical protein